jgi:hypothetical protein
MPGRWLLFASSYSPLFLLAGFRSERAGLRLGLYITAATCALALVLVIAAARHLEPQERTVTGTEDRGPDVAGYLATYLLPLLATPEPSTRDLTAYGAFILLVGLVYVRSSMVAVNPLVYVLGYRLSEISTAAGARQMLVSRDVPTIGRSILVRRVIPGLLLAVATSTEPPEDQ